ncbi:MAG: hypothetical protein WCH83_06320 [Alphaproteobacteria bacterium]
MRFLSFAAIAVVSVMAMSEANAQAQQNFSLVNRSGTQIDEVYVSASSRSEWGRDILGDGVLPAGQRRNITFPRGTRACNFDVKVVFTNGGNAEASNLNLCEITVITVTPNGRFATE